MFKVEWLKQVCVCVCISGCLWQVGILQYQVYTEINGVMTDE
jgi:hypothetical protein